MLQYRRTDAREHVPSHYSSFSAVPRSPPGPVSQIPGMQAGRETLKSRRVPGTGFGLPERLARRRPEALIERPLLDD